MRRKDIRRWYVGWSGPAKPWYLGDTWIKLLRARKVLCDAIEVVIAPPSVLFTSATIVHCCSSRDLLWSIAPLTLIGLVLFKPSKKTCSDSEYRDQTAWEEWWNVCDTFFSHDESACLTADEYCVGSQPHNQSEMNAHHTSAFLPRNASKNPYSHFLQDQISQLINYVILHSPRRNHQVG